MTENLQAFDLSKKKDLERVRLEKMRTIMLANEKYKALLGAWAREEVEQYLRHIAQNDAPSMIREIDSETVVGLGCLDFHERFEMLLLEEIVDDFLMKPGAYRQALREGRLSEYDFFKKPDGTQLYPYFDAHPKALKAEMEFLREVANKLGYEVGVVALLIARPVFWNEMKPSSKETIQHFYEFERKHNLGISSEEESGDVTYPKILPEGVQEELFRAERFYLDHGASYPILPSELLQNNGLK